ncbi:hypothetical protein FOZ63_016610, partial [Perkinsus olseni]
SPFTQVHISDLVVGLSRHDDDGVTHSQVVVPPSHVLLQHSIVKSSHNGPMAGLARLLKLTVGRVVKSRDLCINYIPRRHAAEASGFHPADRRPGRSIGVDHCGPYKDNGGRTKYLAVATCLLTEFFDAEVVGSTNASNLILGYRRIFSGRGKAHRVCSDPGPAYVRAQYRSIIKG